MIVSGAVKIYIPKLTEMIMPVHRHKDARTIMTQLLGYDWSSYAYQDGFLTDKGEFLDRHTAAIHAYECGQLVEDAETERIEILMTEDLW